MSRHTRYEKLLIQQTERQLLGLPPLQKLQKTQLVMLARLTHEYQHLDDILMLKARERSKRGNFLRLFKAARIVHNEGCARNSPLAVTTFIEEDLRGWDWKYRLIDCE